jgi:hypothetical protein
MKIILNGKKVRKEWVAWYLENQAFFKKEGLKKRIVLHELYHHLVKSKDLVLLVKEEETEANYYARKFMNY